MTARRSFGEPHTAFSNLKAMREVDGTPPDEATRATLIALHGEVASNWRDLHGTRFRLLGLLPVVTIGAIALAPAVAGTVTGAFATVLVAALGLAVSQGLWIYDRRNDELYDYLLSRGRRIEAELGVEHGPFRGRPDAITQRRTHGKATALIYAAVRLTWAAALGAALVNLVHALVP